MTEDDVIRTNRQNEGKSLKRKKTKGHLFTSNGFAEPPKLNHHEHFIMNFFSGTRGKRTAAKIAYEKPTSPFVSLLLEWTEVVRLASAGCAINGSTNTPTDR